MERAPREEEKGGSVSDGAIFQPRTRHPRTILFLQGPATMFFAELGRALAAAGHRIRRINLCFGDRLFWRMPGAVDFRGTLAEWPSFLDAYLVSEGVTDIVLFGDCRPYHRIAIELAASHRIDAHVFELGYIRPDWITCELSGVNARSSLPRDPSRIMELAAHFPKPEVRYEFRSAMFKRSLWDIAYNISSLIGWPAYPGYVRHRPFHPLAEYGAWALRLARLPLERRLANRRVRDIIASGRQFFLYALQLESDYQIRMHSPFRTLSEASAVIIASFARAAPQDAILLVKNHPLDNGLVDRRREVARIARQHGVRDRVVFIDGGDLGTILKACSGVVVVNSTTALIALGAGRPVMALGAAVFGVPGLTFRGQLDRFWENPTPPDRELFAAYRRVVIGMSQLRGSYFDAAGRACAIIEFMERLEARAPAHAPAEAGDYAPAGEPAAQAASSP